MEGISLPLPRDPRISRDKQGRLLISSCLSIVGSLGTPSKMPGLTYGLEAGTTCPRSKRLIETHGESAVCHFCYAKGGNYQYPSVKLAHSRRLVGLSHPLWVEAMTRLINHYRHEGKKETDTRYFRWHDTGDIIDLQHLRKIVEVVRGCPDVRFWLPTHEPKTIELYLKLYRKFPSNLTVRISADLLHKEASTVGDLPTSTVSSGIGFVCPSNKQANSCLSCRACWNSNVKNIDYPLH